MPENRFHELLGLPEEVSDPDYYQLLGVQRPINDPGLIEARFKERMTKVQHIENPRHKEFLEFLKGELKRARGILADDSRRAEYDRELAEERADELRKILSHMLVDGTLTSIAEISVVREGRNLGLDDAFTKRIVDEELRKAGGRRVAANTNGNSHQTQQFLNLKAQEISQQKQEAKMAAWIADERDKRKKAESGQKKAEEQVQVVLLKARQIEMQKKQVEQHAQVVKERAIQAEIHQMRAEKKVEAVTKKARDAEALARKAITREHLAAARERMSAREREELEQQFKESEQRFQAYVDATNEELEIVKHAGDRWKRISLAYAAIAAGLVAGAALPKYVPAAAAKIESLASPYLAKLGSVPHAAAPLAAVVFFLLPLHWLAAKKGTGWLAPLLAILALSVVAGAIR